MSLEPTTDSVNIRVRHMRSADLEAVVALDHASFTLPWPARSYRFELFENPSSLLYVAEIPPQDGAAGQVVGVIVIWLIIDEAHVATIAVDPELRGRAIGRQLLSTALSEAIQRGAQSATLEVRRHNLPAQALYRRFRFEVVGQRPRYYQDNHEDALIMTVSGLDASYLEWLESGGWRSAPRTPPAGE
ncbi:MAG: ribosomal protein S18-alanine N-acetyltransferase [Chloroflexota bacterium]